VLINKLNDIILQMYTWQQKKWATAECNQHNVTVLQVV
jgi:hypothetical protein